MSAALRIQGTVFCIAALSLAVLGPWLPSINGTAGLLIIAGLILLLGVPHGALDPVFARHLHGLRNASGWVAFGLCYSAVAGLVIVCWRIAPTPFLIAFLLVSVAHFSGDLGQDVPLLAKALYGGAIIVLPALFHAAQIEPLFDALVGPQSAHWITRATHWLALPWLAGVTGAALALRRRMPRTALELVTLACLALGAPPLYAFTAYFCLMHGARHILRTAAYAGDMPAAQVIALAALPMVLVALAALAVPAQVHSGPLNATIVQTVFVGLAALTVPHMALVERVRHAGWTRPPGRLPPASGGMA